MNIVINIIHIIGEIAEVLAFIICFDFLEIFKISKTSLFRLVFSIIAFIALTAMALYFNESSLGLAAFFATIIYLAKYIFVLFIIYGKMRLKMIYVAIFIDQIISFAAKCFSCFSAIFLILPRKKQSVCNFFYTYNRSFRTSYFKTKNKLPKSNDSSKTDTKTRLCYAYTFHNLFKRTYITCEL